jgi:hypothetical protein
VLFVFALGLSGVVWQWRRAEEGQLIARRNAYASDMNLAQRALQAKQIELAANLLNRYRPESKSSPDLRAWEWRYLRQFCVPDESVMLQPGSARL